MIRSRSSFIAALLFGAVTLHAQDTLRLFRADLPRLKEAGAILPGTRLLFMDEEEPAPTPLSDIDLSKGGRSTSMCDCWIAPDSTYTRVHPNLWAPTADDGSLGPIALPFSFNLYGTTYDRVYININGNLSFGAGNGTYSAEAFPMPGVPMVAAFWGDVDLRALWDPTLNNVYYKRTASALYVNWVRVGYYSLQTDKLNTFQLIITDGNDATIGVGNNVSFCYLNMDWTTGSASQGVNGFGGVPATVGANLGDGINYIQFGRYDHAGYDSDGPFGGPDGVDVLDGQHFRFSTNTSLGNLAPIVTSDMLCDTLQVCIGAPLELRVGFLAPEVDQHIVATTATAPTLGTLTTTLENFGSQVNMEVFYVPVLADVGFHEVTLTATDDGIPALTSTVSFVVEVIYTEDVPPTITGDAITCPGDHVTLTASAGYVDYGWNTGATTPSIAVGPGTYVVRASTDLCRFASNTIVVSAYPQPSPVITGVPAMCNGEFTNLTVPGSYASILWSTGANTPSISAPTGTYTVTVTNAEGCSATSAPLVVVTGSYPQAAYTMEPTSPVAPGVQVIFTAQESTVPVVQWQWSVNGGDTMAYGTTLSYLPPRPGPYTVSLTVTTAEGCSATMVGSFLVNGGELEIPNVFSPNGDGLNDAFVLGGTWSPSGTHLTIYNRWGTEIFTSNNYRDNWTAQDVPDGTYYYVVETADGKRATGHVTIVR